MNSLQWIWFTLINTKLKHHHQCAATATSHRHITISNHRSISIIWMEVRIYKGHIFKMVWVSPFFMRDLLKIENQIPYFVLQKLFEESRTEIDTRTLPSLILSFFNHAVDRPTKVLERYVNLEGRHLLDLFRKSFIRTPCWLGKRDTR